MKSPTTVPEAATLLDQVKPGWYNKVDVSQLNANVFNKCILGQVYGSYVTGINTVFPWPRYESVPVSLFCNRGFEDQWVQEINRRKNVPPKQPKEATQGEKPQPQLDPLEANVLANLLNKERDGKYVRNDLSSPAIDRLIVKLLTIGKVL